MLNSTIIEILRTLSEDEISKFDSFVSSPYYNKKSAVVKLWESVKKYAPEFNSPELEREKVYSNIFPGKEYNYGTFKNLVFEITKLAEKFLMAEKLQIDDFQSGMYLLEQYRDRSLNRLLEQKYKNTEKSISKNGAFAEYNFRSIKLLEFNADHIYYNYPGKTSQGIYVQIFKHTIYYLLDRMFESYNNILTMQDPGTKAESNPLVKVIFENINFEKILPGLEKEADNDYKILLLQYKKYLAEGNPENTNFYYDYKKFLTVNFDYLSTFEKYNSLNSIITPLMLMECDPLERTAEYNDINKLRVKSNLVLNNDGSLSPTLYAGIVTNAAWLRDAEFLSDFISVYHKKLPEEHKENMGYFEMTYLSYAKGDFRKALEYSSKFDLKTFSFKHFIKSLQLALMFELNDYEGFLYQKDAFKHFLQYNKSTFFNNDSHLNLVKYIERLFKIREENNYSELEELKKEILKDNKVRTKYWLIEKITQLQSH